KQVVEELSQQFPHLKNYVTLSPIPGLARWLESQAQHDERAARIVSVAQSGPDELAAVADSLRELAAFYIVEAKRGDGLPLDPVARFHLGNGALVHDVHAGADMSSNGIRQSCGAMVNYLYDLRTVEQNHEDFVTSQTVTTSRPIRAMVKAALAN